MDKNASSCICIKFTLSGTKRGMIQLSGIALFIIPVGVAFGVAAIENGMTAGQALFMSAFVFSAAAQFATLDLWTTGSALTILIIVLAVSARLVLMGAALSPWINHLKRRQRLPALSMMTDPNFADCFTAFRKGETDFGRFFGGGFILWLGWMLGTGIGAIAGSSLGDLSRFGIDVLMPCYFAALILSHWLDEWEGKHTYLPAFAAAGVAIFGLFILPDGWNIVAAAIAGGAVGGLIYEY